MRFIEWNSFDSKWYFFSKCFINDMSTLVEVERDAEQTHKYDTKTKLVKQYVFVLPKLYLQRHQSPLKSIFLEWDIALQI